MRKIIIAAFCFAALGSCKKDTARTTTNTNTTIADGWTLGTVTHSTEFTQQVNGMHAGATTRGIMALQNFTATSSGDNIAAYFATLPTSGGTYHVVAAYPGTGTLAANETYVIASGQTSGSYASTGTGSIDVTVTVSGGKITAIIPDLPVQKINGTDMLTAGGTIKER